jgi:hypothetical protein
MTVVRGLNIMSCHAELSTMPELPYLASGMFTPSRSCTASHAQQKQPKAALFTATVFLVAVQRYSHRRSIAIAQRLSAAIG